MPFGPDNIPRKGEAAYRTVYLRQRMIDKIEKIAAENETSFNAVIVSMVEQCLKEYEDN
ncbi:MAG: hypothetical protein K2O11_11890 [Oscillospiraceae bacterium]|nr:hypothetical protein [Oscillospiraceae bacterium]